MSDYGHLHEAEDVWLISEFERPCSDLWEVLQRVGLFLDDDVFVADRIGKLPIWQSRSIVSVHVFLNDEEVHGPEESWNRIRLRYLLATLPADASPIFVDIASRIAEALSLPMHFRDSLVTSEELSANLDRFLLELKDTVGEAGSREVAAAIEMTYPRN